MARVSASAVVFAGVLSLRLRFAFRRFSISMKDGSLGTATGSLLLRKQLTVRDGSAVFACPASGTSLVMAAGFFASNSDSVEDALGTRTSR